MGFYLNKLITFVAFTLFKFREAIFLFLLSIKKWTN